MLDLSPKDLAIFAASVAAQASQTIGEFFVENFDL